MKHITDDKTEGKAAIPLLYTFAFMAIGSFMPYVAPYLKTLGFSGTQIGTVTATGTTVAIFAVAFWGSVYSAIDHKNDVGMKLNVRQREAVLLACLSIGACIFALCLKSVIGFALVLLFYALIYFVQPPTFSLIDAFAVYNQGTGSDKGFGGKRAWGSVGFALGVLIGGRAAGITSEGVVFYLYIACFMITAAVLIYIAVKNADHVNCDTPASDAAPEKNGSYRMLLCEKRVCQLLICMFFMGGTNVANNTYFSFLYIEGGGTLAGVGIVMLLMVGSEVPFMAWCDKLAQRFTLQKTILYAMIISSARFILYGFGLPWWMLVVLSFTQGAVNGIILVEFIRYISRIAPAGCKSLAVSAYYVIGSNISTIVCQFFGGLILDSFGAAGVYMFFGLFNLAGTILYVLFGLHKVKI